MKAPHKEVLRKVVKWLNYADEDLQLARHGLTLKTGCPYRLIAYHAQQCTEKYLKAYLVYQGVDFPYTHNISLLLELCAKHANWAEKLREAEELTPYAITARYPGEDEQVSRKETSRAIKIASHVREVVRAEFTKNGIIFNKSSE